tara:strand:+ start:242 stop:1057 length:816 start_codon:yes stop_codon:yes gene_type:complete
MKTTTTGIFIYDNNFERVTVSDGAHLVDKLNGVDCKKKTYVPKTTWKNTTGTKYNVNKTNYLLNVSVRSLNKKHVKQFQKFKISECKTLRDVNFIQESLEFKKCINSVKKHLTKYNREQTNIIQHRLYFSDKSLRNNTFNNHNKEYLGMHLDSYEGQKLNDRNNARNRICINLGLQSRFLLFYRTPILEMARKNNNITDNQNINEIYTKYMTVQEKEPIFRIEVKPFEYYIAPTENIIHDGSNWPSTSPDINLVFRGKFSYKKNSIFGLSF